MGMARLAGLYRRFTFYLCGFLVVAGKKSPLKKGARGCKLVLMKMGNNLKKHNPLNPPFLRGINSTLNLTDLIFRPPHVWTPPVLQSHS